MLKEEFEQRTSFYPDQALYSIIEKHYMEFNGDKDAFCKAYKKNADGFAEKIQREADMQAFKALAAVENAVKDYGNGGRMRIPTTCGRPTTKSWQTNPTQNT